jgi:hypothetical protein
MDKDQKTINSQYVCAFVQFFPVVPTLEHNVFVKRVVSLEFPHRKTVIGLLGREMSPSQGRYLHRTTQTQNKLTQTSMPRVGLESTISVFERAKTVMP